MAEEVGVSGLDALTREQRVHPVLQRRTHSRQHDSVAEQIAKVSELARRDVRLRQQFGAEQMRERARIDASVFTRAAAIAFVRSGCERCSL